MFTIKLGRASSGVLRRCHRELTSGKEFGNTWKVMNSQSAMDNPYWPNSSAVERARDAAANLSPPKVKGAKWTLNETDIECLTAGAGILASGGGGDPNEGFRRAMRVHEDKQIKLVNPCRVDAEKMGKVCTVALMGDPMAEMGTGSEGTLLALERMQQVIASEGRYEASKDPSFPSYVANEEDLKNVEVDKVQLPNKITALTAVETGGLNTIEPLLVSAENGLPCLDAAGQGRSYPELQMFMPFIYGSKFCPAALADTKGHTVTCAAADSCKDLENFFRKETVKMGSLSSIAMGVMNFESVLLKMVLFATSRAWQLGRAVKRAMEMQESFLDAIVDQQQGFVLLTGTVTEVKPESKNGFTRNITTVKGAGEYQGNAVRITALNENFIAEKLNSAGMVEDTLATIPDLITVVNLEARNPLEVAVMAGPRSIEGKKVAVVILPADPRLYTEQALKVVGPRAFDLDMDYKKPKPLITKCVCNY